MPELVPSGCMPMPGAIYMFEIVKMCQISLPPCQGPGVRCAFIGLVGPLDQSYKDDRFGKNLVLGRIQTPDPFVLNCKVSLMSLVMRKPVFGVCDQVKEVN